MARNGENEVAGGGAQGPWESANEARTPVSHHIPNVEALSYDEIKDFIQAAGSIRAWGYLERAIKAYLLKDAANNYLTLIDFLDSIEGCNITVKAISIDAPAGTFICGLDGQEKRYLVKIVEKDVEPHVLDKDCYPVDDKDNLERLLNAGFLAGRG